MDTANTLTEPMPIRRGSGRTVALLALVGFADFLIFGHQLGINLFLFALAVFAGILLSARRRPRLSMAAFLLSFSILASAPLVESPSLTGVALCLGALMSVALISARLLPRR
ncbi:DUF4173 domain-containing protein, partial [Rhizobium leguminosarum bv. viciae]